MITDRENLFSQKQVVTATSVGTDVIKVSAKMRADPHQFFVQVESAINNITSRKFQFVASAAADLSSPRVIADSGAIALATLNAAAGYRFAAAVGNLAPAENYLGIQYTDVGTAASTGAMTAGIVEVVESVPAERPAYFTGR